MSKEILLWKESCFEQSGLQIHIFLVCLTDTEPATSRLGLAWNAAAPTRISPASACTVKASSDATPSSGPSLSRQGLGGQNHARSVVSGSVAAGCLPSGLSPAWALPGKPVGAFHRFASSPCWAQLCTQPGDARLGELVRRVCLSL